MITASRWLLLTAAALAIAGPTHAQTARDPARAAVERADEVARAAEEPQITDPTVFVKSAALGDLTGIELAKLARSKAQNADVRSFADRMLKDYGAFHKELETLAKRKRLDVPASLVYEDEQMVEQAAEKSEAEFDDWYARQMIAEQEKALALYQGAAKLPDAELAAFAKRTLPRLEEHHRMALALANAASP